MDNNTIMKKLSSIFIFIFAFASCFSQIYQPATLFGSRDNGRSVGRFFAFPTGCGAPATPIAQDIAEKRGGLYNDTCGHYIFTWDPSLNAWDTLLSTVGSSGSTAWGTITGSIGAQTDLIAQLNLKLNLSDTSGMLAAYARSINNLSPLFNASISSHAISFTFQSAPTRTFFGRGAGGAGDPSYISWDSLPGSNLTFSSGLLRTGNNIVALNLEAIWNTNEFQDYPIQSGQPNNDDIWVFNLSTHQWELRNLSDIVTGGGGGSSGSGVNSFFYIDTTYNRLATIMNDSTAKLKSIRLLGQNGLTEGDIDATDSTLSLGMGLGGILNFGTTTIDGNNVGSLSIPNLFTFAVGTVATGGGNISSIYQQQDFAEFATSIPATANYAKLKVTSTGNIGLDDNLNDKNYEVGMLVCEGCSSNYSSAVFLSKDYIREVSDSIQLRPTGFDEALNGSVWTLIDHATGTGTWQSLGDLGAGNIYTTNGTVVDAARDLDLFTNSSVMSFLLSSTGDQSYLKLYGDGNNMLFFQASDGGGNAMVQTAWGADEGGITQTVYSPDGGARNNRYRSVDNDGVESELSLVSNTASGHYFDLFVGSLENLGIRGYDNNMGGSSMFERGFTIQAGINGDVNLQGGFNQSFGYHSLPVVDVPDGDYTFSDPTDYMINMVPTITRTITLPSAVTFPGRIVYVHNDANDGTVLSVVSVGGQQFNNDGAGSTSLSSNWTIGFQSNGTKWLVIAYTNGPT